MTTTRTLIVTRSERYAAKYTLDITPEDIEAAEADGIDTDDDYALAEWKLREDDCAPDDTDLVGADIEEVEEDDQ